MGFSDIFASEMEPICPSCNQPLEKVPKGSGTCKKCKQKYYISKDYETGAEILTNADGRQSILLKNKNFRRYLEWFNPYDKTTNTLRYDQTKKELIRKRDDWFNKFPNGTYNDFIWSLLNEQVSLFAPKRDYLGLSSAYYKMAVILHEEGKDNFNVLSEARKMDLLHFQEEERLLKGRKLFKDIKTKVFIYNSLKDRNLLCEDCRRIYNKEMPLQKAIELNLLPVKNCTCGSGFCDCFYINEHDLIE